MKTRLFQNESPEINNLPKWVVFLSGGLMFLMWTDGSLRIELSEHSSLSELTLRILYSESTEFEIDHPTVDKIISAHKDLQEIGSDVADQLGRARAANVVAP